MTSANRRGSECRWTSLHHTYNFKRHECIESAKVRPNTSVNLTHYGRCPAPGYAVMFIVAAPGAGHLPQHAGYFER
jgi:hypothetical protein